MSKLNKISKRSSLNLIKNANKVLNAKDYSLTLDAMSNDISDLLDRYNNFLMPLLNGVAKGSDDEFTGLTINAFSSGLDGSTLFTFREATSSDPKYFYDSLIGRSLTIKESIATIYQLLIDELNSRLNDIIVAAEGLTEAEVNALIAVVTDPIETDIEDIKSFIGKGVEDLPIYTDHVASVTYINDEDPLEKAIALLDEAIAAIVPGTVLPSFTTGEVLFGNGSDTPTTDSNFFWDDGNSRLGLKTSSPEKTLDVRGTIQHENGVISRGGDTRGTGATDLQYARTNTNQVASGSYSTIIGGYANRSSGDYSVSGGVTSAATGRSATAFGEAAVASASYATSLGYKTTASGVGSTAFGNGASATLYGQLSHSSGYFTSSGDAQWFQLLSRITTTDATLTKTALDGGSTYWTLSNDTSYNVEAFVVGRGISTNDSAAYKLEFLVKRNANAASITFVGSPTITTIAEDSAGWDVNVAVDTVNGNCDIFVQGGIGTTVNWTVAWNITQVTG